MAAFCASQAAKHYDSEYLNAAHFFLRVDNKNVFTDSIGQIKAKLDAEGTPIAISSSFSAGASPAVEDLLPRDGANVVLHDIHVEKGEALAQIRQLLNDFPTFVEGSEDTVGQADNATAMIRLGDRSQGAIAVDWQRGGQTNPVRLAG